LIEDEMKNLDVFLTGFPRTGTTMLSGLLTSKKDKTWCMCEPTSGGGKHGVVSLCKTMFDRRVDVQQPLEEIAAEVGLEKWGIKEIDPRKRFGVVSQYNPDKIIVLHRDVRDVALSVIEFLGEGRFNTTAKMADYITYLITEFIRFLDWVGEDELILLGYEDIIGESQRAELSDQLDWPLNGDHNLYMIGRRSGELRDGIFDRRKEKEKKKYGRLIRAAHKVAGEYQERFEYETP
jgi:hypothetical protein